MTQQMTQSSTGKQFLASWVDPDNELILSTPPILFSEDEVPKVRMLLEYTGVKRIEFLEVIS